MYTLYLRHQGIHANTFTLGLGFEFTVGGLQLEYTSTQALPLSSLPAPLEHAE